MKYFFKTKSPLFSLIAVIPMAVFYEIFLLINNKSDITGVRNGADIFIKRILVKIGFHGLESTILIFLVLFIIVSLIHKIHFKHKKIEMKYYPLIIAESIFYSFFLYFITRFIISNIVLLRIGSDSLETISYSLGAGVYEELIFRAVLLQLLFMLFKKIPVNENLGIIVALILSSLVFAGAHYVGNLGDAFNVISFVARFIGGMILGILYLFRGFAITSYTHAFYDVLLIFI